MPQCSLGFYHARYPRQRAAAGKKTAIHLGWGVEPDPRSGQLEAFRGGLGLPIKHERFTVIPLASRTYRNVAQTIYGALSVERSVPAFGRNARLHNRHRHGFAIRHLSAFFDRFQKMDGPFPYAMETYASFGNANERDALIGLQMTPPFQLLAGFDSNLNSMGDTPSTFRNIFD